jgi:hypothetical protein
MSVMLTFSRHSEKDSFFKKHTDTPRGTNMFGSLVVIYPIAHEGGELVIRHKDREWNFDAKSLTAPQSSHSLAYVAFYSDIEHEVLKVTGGRRVTITYNLYLADPISKPGASAVTLNLTVISNLQNTLRRLLKSPEFLPTGGTLGFGLAHLYPVTSQTQLQGMTSYLKGEDAHVYRVCRELQLQPSLRMVYDDAESGRTYGIMIDEIIAERLHYDCHDWCYEGVLMMEMGGVSVNKTEDAVPDGSRWVSQEGYKGEFITWISPFNGRNRLHDISIAYGNEFSADYIYCSPCLFVPIAPASERV